ncbi:hypothetical protein [Streptomyces longwoodensis]
MTTVAYTMEASHDLRELHWLFGLTTARATTRGHFPGISAFPLLAPRWAPCRESTPALGLWTKRTLEAEQAVDGGPAGRRPGRHGGPAG